ncbi:MAG: prolipoprotein diacylglyceryl transferase [Kouleothrix sp.]|nr:prolipoprotein diacylglyceryl transferase [Kouleothrix sp.]
MPIYPPDDPFLINTQILGFPLVVRWYGVLIVSGAMLAGWLAARRAERRGYNPEHIWNLLLLGMVLGILGARIYYVAFEWERYAGRPLLEIINPAGGGLAIHGALIGAIVAALIYTRRNKLPFIEFLDICMPGFLLAQAVGRWGNFFNQEAYGRPTSLPFGVRIDLDRRLPPYNDPIKYPPDILFHATFLYESLWNVTGAGLLLWLERRLRGWLRTGDIALFYAIWYGIGRFWIEALRTDSLCTNGVGGECGGALRTAQVVSLLLIAGGLIGIYINHRRALPPPRPADLPSDSPAPTDAAIEPSGSAALDNHPAAGRAAEALGQAQAASGDGST